MRSRSTSTRNAAKWLWQRAGPLGVLTETDRTAIFHLIPDLARSLREKDEARLQKRFDVPRGDGLPPPGIVPAGETADDLRSELKLERDVFAYEDYTVTIAKLHDLEFIPGDRCVLVTTNLRPTHGGAAEQHG